MKEIKPTKASKTLLTTPTSNSQKQISKADLDVSTQIWPARPLNQNMTRSLHLRSQVNTFHIHTIVRRSQLQPFLPHITVRSHQFLPHTTVRDHPFHHHTIVRNQKRCHPTTVISQERHPPTQVRSNQFHQSINKVRNRGLFLSQSVPNIQARTL